MILCVYIDENNRIISVADEGYRLGDKELKAEFDAEVKKDGYLKIYNEYNIPLYKLENGIAVKRSQAEIDADYIPLEESEDMDYNKEINELKQRLDAYEASYASGVQEA